MEPSSYFAVLRRRWITVVVLCVLGIVAAYGIASREKKSYQATTTLLFSQAATNAQDLVESFAQVATKPVVLQPVIDQLKLNTTPSKPRHDISVQVPLNTVILQVS